MFPVWSPSTLLLNPALHDPDKLRAVSLFEPMIQVLTFLAGTARA
jgi:hypothetical protein